MPLLLFLFRTVQYSIPVTLQSTRLPRQQTFYSKEYAMNFPVTSKQPVSEGMRDVTMGVLCSQNGHALVYRGRWRKKAVSVKVGSTSSPVQLLSPLPFPFEHAFNSYKGPLAMS